MLRAGGQDSGHSDEEWIYEVRGKSFLRYMVRKMVGTLVDVGRGKFTPDDIPELLAIRDRSKSGPTMPPHGLCMAQVEYAGPPNPIAIQHVQSAPPSE
jgi:tRNA pseudouridine38-40 synthase